MSFAAAFGTALLGGCASLPSREGISTSSALLDTADTRLGRAVSQLLAAHPGDSGIYPLRDGRDA